MTDVHILAIDLAKRSFQICATAPGGACVDAPGFARRFSDVLAARRLYRSCVRPVRVAHRLPLAGMQFEERGPHRFSELLCSSPGTGFHVLNIEVLAA